MLLRSPVQQPIEPGMCGRNGAGLPLGDAVVGTFVDGRRVWEPSRHLHCFPFHLGDHISRGLDVAATGEPIDDRHWAPRRGVDPDRGVLRVVVRECGYRSKAAVAAAATAVAVRSRATSKAWCRVIP